MPFIASCPKCGKRLNVRDELAGKRLRCPGCGETFEATPSGAAGGAKPIKPPKDKGDASAGIAISWGPILLIAAGLLVVGGIVAFILGPKRVHGQWEQIGTKASDDVVDVVQRGLGAYLSWTGEWDPNKTSPPKVDEPMFIFDRFVMSMPKSVPFRGGSNQGTFAGKYHPQTGEIEADCDIGGGLTLTGKVTPGHTKIRITGRMKDGQVSAEVNGKDAVIKYPPKTDD